jgi:hypothetical protein
MKLVPLWPLVKLNKYNPKIMIMFLPYPGLVLFFIKLVFVFCLYYQMIQETIKTRYNDNELQEFKQLISEKIRIAREELLSLASSLNSGNTNGTDDTASSGKTLEDGSATLEKESINQLAARQKNSLNNWKQL